MSDDGEAYWEQEKKNVEAERVLIRQRICPKCKFKSLSVKCDGRQAGATGCPGEWHNIFCNACGYRVDMVM